MSDLKTYLRSSFAGLYAVTHEEDRAMLEINAVAESIKFQVWRWTASSGLIQPDNQAIEKVLIDKQEKPTIDPAIALFVYMQCTTDSKGKLQGTTIPNKSLLVLQDFHLILSKREPAMIRRIKDALALAKKTSRSIMVMGCQLNLPPELEKEFTTVEFPLPGKELLTQIAEKLAGNKGIELNGKTDAIVDAAFGLTAAEFADAAAASLTEHNDIVPSVIAEIKAHTIKKGGILEIIKPGVTFDNLGGMHEVKAWITKRKGAFTKAARDYGLPVPKGVVLFGVQGGGKSFLARAISSELDCPLIRLDTGRLFGGIVGQSEANTRAVITQIEAFGKCILWIDEIDKGFAGMKNANDGDGGTTRRVIGSFLTWMAEKTTPVFIVATANDLTKLPPELLRKGRWDEMFFIDLPSRTERKEIWKVQISMTKREAKDYNLDTLADATSGWTGAEIQALMGEALYSAFGDGQREPDTDLLVALSKDTMPLSATMKEDMANLRRWAQGRCRLASKPEVEAA